MRPRSSGRGHKRVPRGVCVNCHQPFRKPRSRAYILATERDTQISRSLRLCPTCYGLLTEDERGLYVLYDSSADLQDLNLISFDNQLVVAPTYSIHEERVRLNMKGFQKTTCRNCGGPIDKDRYILHSQKDYQICVGCYSAAIPPLVQLFYDLEHASPKPNKRVYAARGGTRNPAGTKSNFHHR